MGATDVQAAEEGLEITELEKFEVDRIDGVASPANGTPILLMKALPANLEPPTKEGFTGTYGGVPAPDPAAAAGCGCCADCTCAPDAAKSAAGLVIATPLGVPDGIVDLAKEASRAVVDAYLSIDGPWSYMDGALVKRTFTAQQRRDLADRGQALPDGSYPIENEEDLHNAAGLAQSGHGNVAGAKRLIAKMARKLGVKNPLKKKPKGSGGSGAAKSTVAEGGTAVDTGAQDKQIAKLVHEEVAKALKPHEEREQALEAELAKANTKIAEFAATPIPGGPVLRAVTPQGADSVKKAELLAKAEEADELARTLADPDRAAANAKLAAQYRAEAAKA